MTTPVVIDTDFATYVDFLETATLTLRGSGAVHVLTAAHHNQVRAESHLVQNGLAKQGDAVWHFPVSQSAAVIPLGSTLRDAAGDLWTILGAHLQVAGSKWEVLTRNLNVENQLDTVALVQRSTPTKSAAGELLDAWTTTAAHRAAFHHDQDELEVDRHADDARRTFTVVLETALAFAPTAQYRIVDAEGNVYRILSYTQPDDISALPFLRVELTGTTTAPDTSSADATWFQSPSSGV